MLGKLQIISRSTVLCSQLISTSNHFDTVFSWWLIQMHPICKFQQEVYFLPLSLSHLWSKQATHCTTDMKLQTTDYASCNMPESLLEMHCIVPLSCCCSWPHGATSKWESPHPQSTCIEVTPNDQFYTISTMSHGKSLNVTGNWLSQSGLEENAILD